MSRLHSYARICKSSRHKAGTASTKRYFKVQVATFAIKVSGQCYDRSHKRVGQVLQLPSKSQHLLTESNRSNSHMIVSQHSFLKEAQHQQSQHPINTKRLQPQKKTGTLMPVTGTATQHPYSVLQRSRDGPSKRSSSSFGTNKSGVGCVNEVAFSSQLAFFARSFKARLGLEYWRRD